MSGTTTRVDKLLARVKNNPIVAAIIAIGIILVGLATFTDAMRTLLGVLPARNPLTTCGAGQWSSTVIQNPYSQDDRFRYTVQLEVIGENLSEVCARPVRKVIMTLTIRSRMGRLMAIRFTSSFTKSGSEAGTETFRSYVRLGGASSARISVSLKQTIKANRHGSLSLAASMVIARALSKRFTS